MANLTVYLTFDVDQDDANVRGERTVLSWRGIDEIPSIGELLSASQIAFTFFVRCDEQICDVYGSHLAIYERHRPLWDGLRLAGNAFGWHPHLCELRRGAYVPLRDPLQCCQSLWKTWKAIQALEFPVDVVRLGEAWHSTETMCALDSMGLAVDSTAVPGRYRNDDLRQFDWRPTPNQPYHPSPSDYRVPGSDASLRILEVPMTTSPICTDYDDAPVHRYLNPTFHERLFRSGLQAYLDLLPAEGEHHLVLIFHPDELLPRETNGLHAYGWRTFRRNLDVLTDLLTASDHRFEFRSLNAAVA